MADAPLSPAQKDRYKFMRHIEERIAYEQWARDQGRPVTLEGDGTYSGHLTAQHDFYVWLAAAQPQPRAAPLTDAQVADLCGEANRGYCIEPEHYFKAFRDAEIAHGITTHKDAP